MTRQHLTIIVVLAFAVGLLWGNRARGLGSSFLIEGADQTQYHGLSPSGALNVWLDALGTHFVVDNADGLRHAPLAYPSGLHEALNGLPAHFVLDMADSNRFAALAYPQTLIGDTTPPRETEPPSTTPGGAGSVKIRWQTNEFSRGTVEYGTAPGQYTRSVSEPLHVKAHEVTLTGLAADATYYYRITNTDRAGNSARAPERSVTPGPDNKAIFLPVTIR